MTTQAVSGQKYVIGKGFTDHRIQVAVIMSPSGPANGNLKQAFGSVKIPWMLLTGTKDSNPINGADASTWLDGDTVRSVLEKDDQWEKK